ncbi:hypothetical protein GCM10011610_11860 [Nocardia rhizosphaerihabitans]|uniref:Uncharacterized protein n=1 Tax=Nocardia rhizosphaerihabitans TaxID=1691570 RepID=A0ABQ2K7H8_9NOCA|nr:hypothetical protein GCM10011610_11860 [Nocardia rhizosphaerihabitans]
MFRGEKKITKHSGVNYKSPGQKPIFGCFDRSGAAAIQPHPPRTHSLRGGRPATRGTQPRE